jgi:hypothetical protein
LTNKAPVKINVYFKAQEPERVSPSGELFASAFVASVADAFKDCEENGKAHESFKRHA